jgi:trimethylamine:corrinoid methyltransferase-like protein
LGNRVTREQWEKQGALDIRARAREQYKKILATHQPKPLEPEVRKKLQQIVDEAEA